MILNLNSQIIWVFVDLLILFVLMKKFLFGPITQMLDDRAQQVSDTLDQADKRLAAAEQQQTAHAAQLASAKQEAAQIIEDARARGQQEYDRLVAEAQTAVQRLDEQAARRFQAQVDAACVYWNAPTSFTDGAQFGLGAEIGISTQKLGPRGPMGLDEICTYKWIVEGNGQTRP